MYVEVAAYHSNVFEEQFWFWEVEALRVDELRIWVQKQLAAAYFEEAVEDDDEYESGKGLQAQNPPQDAGSSLPEAVQDPGGTSPVHQADIG